MTLYKMQVTELANQQCPIGYQRRVIQIRRLCDAWAEKVTKAQSPTRRPSHDPWRVAIILQGDKEDGSWRR